MRQFSDPHLAALAVLVVASVGGVATARRHPGRPTVVMCRALAVAIFAGWAGEYVADVVTGIWTVRYDLPLQLTDAVSVTSVLALWTRRPGLAELVYLWALSASLQATITPDLAWTFPSVFYFTYFVYHVGAIVAGLTLVFGCRLYPRPGAAWRAFGATLLVAAAAATADLGFGANYMYLARKPAHGSLLSVLGPWPWYIAAAAGVGLGMLFILQGLASVVARSDRRVPRGSPG
jgi:hypothetical integral membrane protein (TIGR02206 family)